ncbi:unnamed protein product, partial [Ixodes hexagonus]
MIPVSHIVPEQPCSWNSVQNPHPAAATSNTVYKMPALSDNTRDVHRAFCILKVRHRITL